MVNGKCILKIAPYEGLPKLSDLKITNKEFTEELADGGKFILYEYKVIFSKYVKTSSYLFD